MHNEAYVHVTTDHGELTTNGLQPTTSDHGMPAYILIPLLLLVLAAPTRAQQPLGMPDPETTGRYYLLAFPDTTATVIDTVHQLRIRDTFVVLIYSGVPNRAVFSGAGGYHREVALEGGHFTTVYLNDSANRPPRIVCDVVDRPMPDVIRLETDEPVVVYCQMYTRFGGEGWTPIPVDRWGTEYYAIAPPGAVVEDVLDTFPGPAAHFMRRMKGAPAEMLMIAAYDGTTIDVDGLGSIGRRSITLNARECYQAQTAVDTPGLWVDLEDLSGTRITSNHPIGVIAATARVWFRGDTLARLPLTFNSMRGMTVEWLPPREAFGREYFHYAPVDTQEAIENPRPYAYKYALFSYGVLRMMAPIGAVVEILGIRDTVVHVAAGAFYDHIVPAGSVCVARSDVPIEVCAITTPTLFTPGEPDCICPIGVSARVEELIPRTAWTNFAPVYGFYSPWSVWSDRTIAKLRYLDSVRPFITVVTDTMSADSISWDDGSPFEFDRRTGPSSDLVWGRAEIAYGRERALTGRGNAKFGVAYSASIVGASDDVSGHSDYTTYYEVVSVGMAFPIAPRRSRFPGSARSDSSRMVSASWLGAFPNPFGTATELRFIAPQTGSARLEIVSLLGECIVRRDLSWVDSGAQSIRWDATGCAPGAYQVRISGNGWSVSGTVIVVGR